MIRRLGEHTPQIAPTAYVDESAHVIGNVTIDEHASIWPGAVLRGDMHYIRVGAYTNVQDLCLLHVEEGTMPAILEDHITVGHGVIVHACHVERRCLIGM